MLFATRNLDWPDPEGGLTEAKVLAVEEEVEVLRNNLNREAFI